MQITTRTSTPCSNPLFLGLFTTEKELSGKTNSWFSGKTPGMHQSEDVPKEAEDLYFFLPASVGCWCGQQALGRSGCVTVSSGEQKTAETCELQEVQIKSSPWLSTLSFLLVPCIAFQNYILTLVKLLLDHTWDCIGNSFSFYYSQLNEIKVTSTYTQVAMCMYGGFYRKVISKHPVCRDKRVHVWVCTNQNTFMCLYITQYTQTGKLCVQTQMKDTNISKS